MKSIACRPRILFAAFVLTLGAAALLVSGANRAAGEVDKAVLEAEAKRVAVIAKVKPTVAAVCFYGGEACGSGVVIDEEGYALTNFHVVQPTGPVLQCGLADGKLYDAVVVGLDKVGDVALIKLLPKKAGDKFAFAKLADSDGVKVGDWSMAMGNPFGLSLDFTPTVTYGLVSGVNRYQPPEGKGTLEYTDCIQTDTSINPGNSGGPLFDANGDLIGINGRGSFEKRGRVNSGVGYAISINQIKNFLGHLRAGIDTDHATLGAAIETANEDGELAKMVVRSILEDSDAAKRGLALGDEVVRFAGRQLSSTNQYKNILGIFPKEWRLPLTYRHANAEKKEILVRLMGNIDTVVEKPMAGGPPMPPGPPGGGRPQHEGQDKSPAKKLFEEKKGFANYYFNKQCQDKLTAAFKQTGDFTPLAGNWKAAGTIELTDRKGEFQLTFVDGSDGMTEVKISRNGIDDAVKPLKADQPLGELVQPQGSGGLLAALYQYRRLLTAGKGGFEGGFDHGGHEPFYPPRTDGTQPESLKDLRVDCEVLRTKHASFETKWYFSLADHRLLGCEAVINKEDDPCELYFGDYKPVDGRQLPHRIEVRTGNKKYAVMTVKSYQLDKK
ncbi:S1C family serine protease [Fimbriiglobus ruber]|nr:trypsin-like peptidase domain-containing protein [Fimbriiglobus ruber]